MSTVKSRLDDQIKKTRATYERNLLHVAQALQDGHQNCVRTYQSRAASNKWRLDRLIAQRDALAGSAP